jgi:hypothetical protein
MRLTTKLVAVTCLIGSIGIATSVAPAQAQWSGDRGWNNGTQYGPDYQYYGPRYGAPAYGAPGNYDPGWNTGTQYGADYQYYGPRYGAPVYGWTGNYDRGWNTGTQYGPDYQYSGPRIRRRPADEED